MGTGDDTRAALEQLLADQDGVVARRQLVAAGLVPHEIRRMLRRRELSVVHPGVYVSHTGPLTTRQREWAAVLACWPAALCHESALPGSHPAVVHVAIGVRRTARSPSGVVVHRMASLRQRVRWNASPPRVRVEHAAIDVASGRGDVASQFEVFADVVRHRATTAARLRTVLRGRRGVTGRLLMSEMLLDLEQGACSVLEREYLCLERAHGLPSSGSGAERQKPARHGSKRTYQDVDYPAYGLTVELDGLPFHDTASARDADAGRDLDHAVESGGTTVRLTYGLVFRDGCRTITQVGRLLQQRGWSDGVQTCPGCAES